MLVHVSPLTCRGHKRALDPLELEITGCVTLDEAAGNRTLVLLNSSKASNC